MRHALQLPGLQLAPNWRRLHRSWTVLLSLLLVVLSAAQDHWPLFQSLVSQQRFSTVTMVLGVAIAILRYVRQKSLHQDTGAAE